MERTTVHNFKCYIFLTRRIVLTISFSIFCPAVPRYTSFWLSSCQGNRSIYTGDTSSRDIHPHMKIVPISSILYGFIHFTYLTNSGTVNYPQIIREAWTTQYMSHCCFLNTAVPWNTRYVMQQQVVVNISRSVARELFATRPPSHLELMILMRDLKQKKSVTINDFGRINSWHKIIQISVEPVSFGIRR